MIVLQNSCILLRLQLRWLLHQPRDVTVHFLCFESNDYGCFCDAGYIFIYSYYFYVVICFVGFGQLMRSCCILYNLKALLDETASLQNYCSAGYIVDDFLLLISILFEYSIRNYGLFWVIN